MPDDLSRPSHVGSHDRQARGHRLYAGDSKAFAETGQHEDIGLVEQLKKLQAVSLHIPMNSHAFHRHHRIARHYVQDDIRARPILEPVKQKSPALSLEVAAYEKDSIRTTPT
jgi:hypothetical protein